ncbi:sestrin-1-like [Dysidea avara]|uniref:sestrin-1-like n=1 Tax=Dysidea avara TaxID=196820 RepID=UPI00332DF36E
MATFLSGLENGLDETDFDFHDEAPSFFYGLKQRDKDKRAQALEQIRKTVEIWGQHKDEETAKKLLTVQLPTILRLSVESPFEDVRTAFTKMVATLKEAGVTVPDILHLGPSSFIRECNKNLFVAEDPLTQLDASSTALFVEAFINQLRVSRLIQLLGYHPKYLQCFLRTHNFLMRGDGPLSYPFRHYIAIMAASRHRCSYLVSIQEKEFLEQKGNRDWLQGLDHIPQKLRNLLTLNKLLAHQPWKVQADLFKDLLIGPESFSLGELAHAILIMTHYHALSSFALGCGVNPEIDSPQGHYYGDLSLLIPFCYQGNPALGVIGTTSDSEVTDSDVGFSPLNSSPGYLVNSIDKHFAMPLNNTSINGSSFNNVCNGTESSLLHTLKTVSVINFDPELETKESMDREFRESQSVCDLDFKKPITPVVTPQDLIKYLEDPNYSHEDIESTSPLKDGEYSWEDHAYPLLDRLYPDSGYILDEKFTLAYNLTYHNVGEHKNVDTENFRRAVWNYIQAIKGIRHDDYNYREVNSVLVKRFKSYIRMVACYPEQITEFDFSGQIESLGLGFSEKIHVNMIVLEARLQAELLYAFRALMKYMKQ